MKILLFNMIYKKLNQQTILVKEILLYFIKVQINVIKIIAPVLI